MIRSSGALSLILLTLCGAATPEDPVGAWKLKCVSPDGNPRECVLTIYREGEALKGTCTTGGVRVAARDAVFEQGVLVVRVDGAYIGQAYGLVYKGKSVGDTLDGTIHWSYGWGSGRLPFKGERIVPIREGCRRSGSLQLNKAALLACRS